MPSFPESPLPRDARGLLILLGLLPVGLVLFLLAKFTGSALFLVGFLAFVFGLLAWLYRRAGRSS